MPGGPPRPPPQLLPASPLSFLFPIIFLEIILLAAWLPGQLALLPLSRVRGGCSPGAPPGGQRRLRVSGVRGTQAGGGVWRNGSAPAPEALWAPVWLPPHPQNQAVSIFNCTLASLHQPQVVVFGHVGALLPGPLSFPAGPGGGGLICFLAGQAGGGQVVLGEPGPILSMAEVRKQSPQRIKGPS